MTNENRNNSSAEAPLESWKEIAIYLQRDVSTVIRWEKSEHLPVQGVFAGLRELCEAASVVP